MSKRNKVKARSACNQVLSAQGRLLSRVTRKLRIRVKQLLLKSLMFNPISGSKLLYGSAWEYMRKCRGRSSQDWKNPNLSSTLKTWSWASSSLSKKLTMKPTKSGNPLLSTFTKCYILSSYVSFSYKSYYSYWTVNVNSYH